MRTLYSRPVVSSFFLMATLWNRAGEYIFPCGFYLSSFLWPPCVADANIIFLHCGFFFLFLSFFLTSSQPSQTGCLPQFHTWCGLSANLGCRSETCCMRLAENTPPKKSPSRHHRTTLSGCIFTTNACIDNRKKTC